jgi:hypothetical protein
MAINSILLAAYFPETSFDIILPSLGFPSVSAPEFFPVQAVCLNMEYSQCPT